MPIPQVRLLLDVVVTVESRPGLVSEATACRLVHDQVDPAYLSLGIMQHLAHL